MRDSFSKDKKVFNGAMRKSVNTIIQGTGAYLTNLSMVYIDEYIRKHNKRSRIVITVHDSLVIDCPRDEVDEMAKVAKFIMENLPIDFLTIEWEGKEMRYPIVADVEIGETYNDMVDYDVETVNQFKSYKGYVKYIKDQSKIKDYYDNGLITEEQKDHGIKVIQEAIEAYKQLPAD